MKFKIFSRREAETPEYIEDQISEPYIWISIAYSSDHNAKPWQGKYCKGVLHLRFDDIETEADGLVSFNENHAKSIIDFVNSYKDNIDLICVHCFAGISRSSGVASALSRWLNNGDDSEIMNNPKYFPNNLVRTKILSYLRNQYG